MTDKYGVMPESDICTECNGAGGKLVYGEWIICPACKGNSRVGGKRPDPIKEAEEFKKEREEGDKSDG